MCIDSQRPFVLLERPRFHSTHCDKFEEIEAEQAEKVKIGLEQRIVTDAWELSKQLQKIVADFDPFAKSGFGFSGREGSCKKNRASFQDD